MQNGCVRTKKRSHQTSCLVEDCSLRTRKVLCDHLHPTTNVLVMQGVPRNWLLWFVWFVSFIWLNQTNQINQMNQINQKGRSARYRRRSRPWGVVRS